MHRLILCVVVVFCLTAGTDSQFVALGTTPPPDCDNCILDHLGVGYLPSSLYCFAFFQCQQHETGFYITPMCCAEGEEWDQEKLTCVIANYLGPCFDANRTNFPCPEPFTTTNGPCPFVKDVNDMSKYYWSEAVQYNPYPLMCAPNTVFSEEDCACIHDGTYDARCDKIIHFDFEEDFNSRSCNNYVHGTPRGNPYLRDNAACFEDNSYLQFDYLNNWFNMNPEGETFTFAMWVQPNKTAVLTGLFDSNCQSVGAAKIVAQFPDIGGVVSMSIFENGQFQNDVANFASLGILIDEVWIHLAITYNGTHYVFYHDGVQTAVVEGGEAPANSQLGSTIAAAEWAGFATFFTGCVDDFCFYSKALSQEDVEQLVADGRSGGAPTTASPTTASP